MIFSYSFQFCFSSSFSFSFLHFLTWVRLFFHNFPSNMPLCWLFTLKMLKFSIFSYCKCPFLLCWVWSSNYHSFDDLTYALCNFLCPLKWKKGFFFGLGLKFHVVFALFWLLRYVGGGYVIAEFWHFIRLDLPLKIMVSEVTFETDCWNWCSSHGVGI